MNSTNLPDGWNTINIQQVFTQISTTGKSIKTNEYKPNGKYPVIDQGMEFISGYSDDENKLIHVDSDVVVFGDHTRNFKRVNFDFIAGADGIKILKPKPEFDSLFFFLQCLSLNLPNKGYHRHFRYLKECSFKYPSLQEQQKIAQKLTALLDNVAQIKTRLETIPNLLKTFRQSVLARAVSGELIGKHFTEKDELKNCVSILNGARKPVSSKERELIQGNIPYYGATGIVDYLNDFTHDGCFLLVGEDGANLLSKSKDLAYIVEGKIWVNNHAHVLKENENFRVDFIRFNINTLDLSPWVTGSAQPKLTKKALETLPITKATLAEQDLIIQTVKTYLNFADQIESQVQQALERVNLMTQAILAKGFRGEL